MNVTAIQKLSLELTNVMGDIERFKQVSIEDISINYDPHCEAADFNFYIDNEEDSESIRSIIENSLKRRATALSEELIKESKCL